jgi:hypothetical protein
VNHRQQLGKVKVAFVAAFVSVGLLVAQCWAQRATYDEQVNYFDPGLQSVGSSMGYSELSTVVGGLGPSTAASSAPAGNMTVYVGNYGSYSSGQPSLSDEINFVRISNDIDSNGISGGAIVVTTGPDGQPSFTTVTDFADLHSFDIGFDQANLTRRSGRKSYDAGGVYWIYEDGSVRPDPDLKAAEQTTRAIAMLEVDPPTVRRGTGSRAIIVPISPRPQMVPQYSKYAVGHRGTGVGITYGYYEFGMFDRFRFDAEGGILGRTYSDTEANNWVTGPQLGMVAHRAIGPLNFYGHALGIVGLNDGELQQNNGIGAELVPGALNRLLYAQPSYSQHRVAIADASPTGVLWAEASVQITPQTSFKFAWTAIYVNNILRAEDRVRYFLPDMGFRDVGEQDFMQQFFVCGIEVVR